MPYHGRGGRSMRRGGGSRWQQRGSVLAPMPHRSCPVLQACRLVLVMHCQRWLRQCMRDLACRRSSRGVGLRRQCCAVCPPPAAECCATAHTLAMHSFEPSSSFVGFAGRQLPHRRRLQVCLPGSASRRRHLAPAGGGVTWRPPLRCAPPFACKWRQRDIRPLCEARRGPQRRWSSFAKNGR